MQRITFVEACETAERRLKYSSERVHTERWQGVDISKKPEAEMHEVRYFNFEAKMPTEDLQFYRDSIKPNLPWADDHFEERVCGKPLNPGVQWKHWPYSRSAEKFRTGQKFNHNYMERYWPRWAGMDQTGELVDTRFSKEFFINGDPMTQCHRGIRYRYGDLNDLVEQLRLEPLTRQAYLPIFFPEDTGVANPDRKPCTLGYFFLMRNDKLDVTYYIRSCDFVRHFRDDIYMTVRLNLWILDKLRNEDARWKDVKPGLFRMDIGSLHMFRNDYTMMFERKT